MTSLWYCYVALLDLEDAGRHPEAAAIFYRHCRLQHLIGSLKTPYVALMDGITSKYKKLVHIFVVTL